MSSQQSQGSQQQPDDDEGGAQRAQPLPISLLIVSQPTSESRAPCTPADASSLLSSLTVPVQQHGLSAKDVEKLAEAGYNTIEAVAFTPKKILLTVKGISEAKADKILAQGTSQQPGRPPAKAGKLTPPSRSPLPQRPNSSRWASRPRPSCTSALASHRTVN